MKALRIVHRNALAYRKAWRASIFSSFLQPTLYLFSMGLGVGTLVDRGAAFLPGGVSFLEFLAPGLLAAACMQTATFESSFPIMGKMTWRHHYDAVATTPVGVRDIVLGELAWIALRLTSVAIAFTLVLVAFGVPRTPLVILAIPAAVLTGLACSAPIVAYAGTLRSDQNFNVVFRFVVTPLFLFSGVFFPLTRLPEPLRLVAWLTPLFHGVELVRGLTLGTIVSPVWIAHLAYLVGLFAAGTVAALRTFERRLRP